MAEQTKKGSISVETEHIFPIIKKWLYSEKDIFLREIVSNACDACTKLKRLYSMGEAKDIDIDGFRIDVKLDRDAGTISVTDNGIGMSADEVERYINQIALSGALEFIEKYDEGGSGDGIIGHFGLGFYSAFMVSDKVEMLTKSYTDAPAVSWECANEGNFEMTDGDADAPRGTTVTMYISDEEKEYLDAYKLREILKKYCSFMPVPIYFDDGEKCEHEHEHEDGEHCECEHEHGEEKINDTNPLWMKNPSECTDEEYGEFYKKLFNDYKEPLFYIRLNADYPLNFKGILYFPKYTNEYENLEGQVRLYYNQVFVADNIKEVIPDYMIMLKGVLDCPELPLNVSRSYLQNDAYTQKIAKHISKKVADKLSGMFGTERENYEKIWHDIKPFILYGSMRDEKFYERMKNSVLFKTCDGAHLTLAEYAEKAKDKYDGKVFYATDRTAQSQYISMLSKQGVTVLEFDTIIETQYAELCEQKDAGVKFLRVDAELPDLMKAEETDGEKPDEEKLKTLFAGILRNDAQISFAPLKDKGLPVILTVSEQMRRMNDMMKVYRSFGKDSGTPDFPESEALIVNSSSALIAALAKADDEKALPVAKQLVALARMSRRPLSADEAAEFTNSCYEMFAKLL